MKKIFVYGIILSMLVVFALFGFGCSNGNEPNTSNIDWENRDQRSEQFVMALVNGDYSIAAVGFDADMTRALGAPGLKKAWEDTVKQAGAFVSIVKTQTELNDEYDIYIVISRHENTGISSRIVFSGDDLIAGLFFSFTDILSDWDMTPIKKDSYTEIPIIISEGGDYPLKGIITMPDNTTDKIPAVVLVHGSGPSDMNGVPRALLPDYPNAHFKDIAEYLSSNGIAVLRYDKRGFSIEHATKFIQQFGGSATVWEETIEDAILATNILKNDERIDENRVFILGHSLGGMLAPRIHAMGGNYAGLILFAGSPRSLLEIIYDQQYYYYMETLEGEELEEIIMLYSDGTTKTQLEDQTALIMNMPDDEAKATDGGGVSFYYYKDLLLNPATEFIKDINKPFLVMHADNDWQVFTDRDFAMYMSKDLLGDRSNATFKLYEGLNHIFMPSTATRSIDILDEYKIKANVDEQVLKDIADWIKSN